MTFRSRLEARWAVFFDRLQIPWLYEREGFQLPSGWYVPDFFLPSLKLWVEVKPRDTWREDARLREFAATLPGNWYRDGCSPHEECFALVFPEPFEIVSCGAYKLVCRQERAIGAGEGFWAEVWAAGDQACKHRFW